MAFQAVLGFQVVISMMMLSFLHKFTSHFSIGRWLLTRGLIRFIHPSDDQLKQMMVGELKTHKDSRARHRNNKHQNNHVSGEQFKVPKNTEFVLEACRIRPQDLVDLKYYPEYQWLTDFGFCAAIVFVVTEMFNCFLPKSTEDLNLSLVWCLLVLGFAL